MVCVYVYMRALPPGVSAIFSSCRSKNRFGVLPHDPRRFATFDVDHHCEPNRLPSAVQSKELKAAVTEGLELILGESLSEVCEPLELSDADSTDCHLEPAYEWPLRPAAERTEEMAAESDDPRPYEALQSMKPAKKDVESQGQGLSQDQDQYQHQHPKARRKKEEVEVSSFFDEAGLDPEIARKFAFGLRTRH